MKIKKGLEISTGDFWYDLNEGYLNPEEICELAEDAAKVLEAIKVVKDFEKACEEKIEGFIR